MANLPTSRLLLILAGVYTIQSSVGALSFQAMPAILRDAGYGTEVVGLIYLLMLPWVLKFLWSPYIERYRLRSPFANRRMLLFGNLMTLTLLVLMSTQDPSKSMSLLLGLLMLQAFLCGSIDNATDGFAIDNLAVKERGLANTIQIGSGYAGSILGGGLFLIVLDAYGWQNGMLMISALTLVMLIPLHRIPNRTQSSQHPQPHVPSLRAALRKPVVIGLLIILFYQFGLRLTQGMMMPFFIDQQVDLTQLGFIIAFGSSIASLLAVLISGLLIRRFGYKPMLYVWLLLQLPVYAGFYFASQDTSTSVTHAAVLLISQSMISAAAFVALYTAMMGWASGAQAGVDFSIFQCTDAAIAMLAGMFGGWLVSQISYTPLFMISLSCTALGLCSLVYFLYLQTPADKQPTEFTV